ncbi:MAG TPA: tetrahydrofolate dehydrogenase/cyclohydrolase catalytic domain-containing protein, partial [Actinomycetota bacterium]
MTAVVIDGNAIAEQLRQSIADELQVLRLSEVRPGLATVLIGESFDAQAYESHVKRLAESLDYRYVCERLPEDIELADVIAALGKLNADPRITGILVLHPLPPHIPEAEMNSAVDPRKDIEAVHPMNAGLLAQ